MVRIDVMMKDSKGNRFFNSFEYATINSIAAFEAEVLKILAHARWITSVTLTEVG